jgi:hypothetical protein
METTENKTPWRKNLDPRYISGEDLIAGMKGLKKEMIVTLAKFNDAPTFDQKLQKEVTSTAIWLTDYETKALIYKPVILNVGRGEFLSKELGNNSLYIEDFSTTIPFVMFAQADKRHGFVVRFKKYYAPPTISDVNALKLLDGSKDLEDLKKNFLSLSKEEQRLITVIAKTENLKLTLK